MKIYHHPQEVWDEKKCLKMAGTAPKDHWGNKPPKGIIANSSSTRAQYGQTVRYNGGIVRDGEWFQSEHRPLPKIPDDYEITNLPSWGTVIRKRDQAEKTPSDSRPVSLRRPRCLPTTPSPVKSIDQP